MDPITSFRNEHRFLSNFCPCHVILDGLEYGSTEHAYQAAKTLNPKEREWVRARPTPGTAKRAGQDVTKRADWDDVKVGVMRDLVRQKFKDPLLAKLLLATGDRPLIEGNHWHDRWWGMEWSGTGWQGQNWLGRILMEVREELRRSL